MPVHFRILIPYFLWQPICSLSNYFEIADHGINGLVICQKLLE
jgi:hypothetical protein